jgi:hypothetical protein
MGQIRKRTKHPTTFEERLAEEARRFKDAAEKEPPGSTARELLLRRARQAETASHISDWLRSPGLQPPKAVQTLLGNSKDGARSHMTFKLVRKSSGQTRPNGG